MVTDHRAQWQQNRGNYAILGEHGANALNTCFRCGKGWFGKPAKYCELCAPIMDADKVESLIIAAADPAQMHDYFAFVAVHAEPNKAWVETLNQWRHQRYDEIVPMIAAKFKELDMRYMVVDASAPMVVEMFQRAEIPVQSLQFGDYVEWSNIWGEHKTATIKYAMVEFTRFLLQKNMLELPPEFKDPLWSELRQQLREQEIDIGKTNVQRNEAKVHYRHPSGRHDDLAWALLMALYVARSWIVGSGAFAFNMNQ